jgi:putative transcriptional regulator
LANKSSRGGTEGAQGGLEEEEGKMTRRGTAKLEKPSMGEKLLRSARQARNWVNGRPGRVRVTYVPIPHVDVRKLRASMKLSQTQFAAKFGFSLDSVQNWEQGCRTPEGPARVLLAVIAKNPKAVEKALRSE